MLALGRGLMADPAILLLDEPTLGLSPAVVRSTFAALKLAVPRSLLALGPRIV